MCFCVFLPFIIYFFNRKFDISSFCCYFQIYQGAVLLHNLTDALRNDLLKRVDDLPLFFWSNLDVEIRYSAVDVELFTEIQSPLFNGVLRSRLSPRNTGRQVQTIVAGFVLRKVPFTWWLDPKITPMDVPGKLLEQGLVPGDSHFLMACEVSLSQDAPFKRKSLTKHQVTTPQDWLAWQKLTSVSLELAEPLAARYTRFFIERDKKEGSLFCHYIFREEGKDVGAATLFLQGDVSCIHNLVVDPAYRGKGIARAIVQLLLQELAKYGAHLAAVQSPARTAPLFRDLGFSKVTELKTFILY